MIWSVVIIGLVDVDRFPRNVSSHGFMAMFGSRTQIVSQARSFNSIHLGIEDIKVHSVFEAFLSSM